MYEWRKARHRETVKCRTCGNPFWRYVRDSNPPKYCSNDCHVKSPEHRTLCRNLFMTRNPMSNPASRTKIRESKLARYGNMDFNNMPKHSETMLSKYGVPYAVYLPQCKSNGKRISAFQRKLYVDLIHQHPDAELEKYLPDVRIFVDIFIPSERKIIECYGDYWHCNPIKCSPDYYNHLVHLTAQEIWDRDKKRVETLEDAGYHVEVVWESSRRKRFGTL